MNLALLLNAANVFYRITIFSYAITYDLLYGRKLVLMGVKKSLRVAESLVFLDLFGFWAAVKYSTGGEGGI